MPQQVKEILHLITAGYSILLLAVGIFMMIGYWRSFFSKTLSKDESRAYKLMLMSVVMMLFLCVLLMQSLSEAS